MKHAIIVTLDGPNSSVKESEDKIMQTLSKFPSQYGNNGTSVRVVSYAFDHPEEVTYHIGKICKFVAGTLGFQNWNVDHKEESPAEPFRSWLSKEIRKAGYEIWTGKPHPSRESKDATS